MKLETMILIADSGATKTDWRILTTGQKPYGQTTDGLSPYFQDTTGIAKTISTQLLPQLSSPAVQAVYFYGTGCATPEGKSTVEQALRQSFPKAQTILVDSDMLGAARGACGHEPGIVCILGTGSNACCYNGEQITRGIDSLGFWLGDEGSGGYLGKTLVRDFFQHRLPDDLRRAFVERYPTLDRPTLLDRAYKQPFPNRYFASFTPFLSEHINHPYANGLVTDAFTLFLSTYVLRFPEATEWPVNFVGSIGHYFTTQLRQAVEQAGCTMGQILKSPGDGLVAYYS